MATAMFMSVADLGVLITKKFNRDKPRTVGYVIAYIEGGGLIDRDGRFRVGDEVRTSIPNMAKMPIERFRPSPADRERERGESARTGDGGGSQRPEAGQPLQVGRLDGRQRRERGNGELHNNKHTSLVGPPWFLTFHHFKANTSMSVSLLRMTGNCINGITSQKENWMPSGRARHVIHRWREREEGGEEEILSLCHLLRCTTA